MQETLNLVQYLAEQKNIKIVLTIDDLKFFEKINGDERRYS